MFNIIKGLQIKPQWVTTSDTSELLACLYFFLRDKSACKNVEELLPGYISQWHLKWFVNSLKKRHRINIWSNNSVPKHISEAMLGETNR